MLTKEDLKADPKLANLDDATLEHFVKLNKNDAQVEVDEAVGKLHSRYDADIEAITGVKKPDGGKTYINLKEVLSDLKAKADGAGKASELQGELDKMKSENANLKKQISEGNTDPAVRRRLKELEDEMKVKNDEIENLKTTKEKELKELQEELKTTKTETFKANALSEFRKWEADKNFDPTIPKNILEETLENRRQRILNSIKTTTVDGKTIVVDEEGKPVRNKDNANEPFTPGEYYGSKISDLLDHGKQAKGGGTKGGGNGGGSKLPSGLDTSAWKTKEDANVAIKEHLTKNEGLVKNSEEFIARAAEIREEAGVKDLPLR